MTKRQQVYVAIHIRSPKADEDHPHYLDRILIRRYKRTVPDGKNASAVALSLIEEWAGQGFDYDQAAPGHFMAQWERHGLLFEAHAGTPSENPWPEEIAFLRAQESAASSRILTRRRPKGLNYGP